MKIGVCCGDNVERMKIAKAIGYDYVESNSGDIVKADDELFNQMKNAGIPILSSNCFIGYRIVGPEKDEKKIREYTQKLFARAKELGIEILVFGSSGARKYKEEPGTSIDSCREEITEFLCDIVAPLAEKYEIRVAVEPLRPGECNVINHIAQGVEIAKKVNSPYVKVLADLMHMRLGDEPLSEIEKYSEWLIHAHTSNPDGDGEHRRTYPKAGDKFNQDDFMLPIINAGVEMCSVEADVIDFEQDAREAFEVLKKYR